MSSTHTTSWQRSARRGLTLLEVVAALAILGGVLVGIVLARAKLARQTAMARQLSQAVRLSDDLIASWWARPEGVPVGADGVLGAEEAWVWATSPVANPAIERLGARVVRLEVRPRREPSGTGRAAPIVVDLVLPPEGAR
jgi:prepilin-type N-terminal cleavage/methylation domain-containing protein